MQYLNHTKIHYTVAFLVLCALGLFSTPVKSDHLERSECFAYHDCILGQDSALNKCYDNNFLKEIGTNRDMCMRIAQHECKVKTGISGRGKKLTLSRPFDWYHRLTLLEQKAQPDAGTNGDQDIRVYNYAGLNHCPPQYQGLRDFWCDPRQLRYPPRPWCDVLPIYNVQEPARPDISSAIDIYEKPKTDKDNNDKKVKDQKASDKKTKDNNDQKTSNKKTE